MKLQHILAALLVAAFTGCTSTGGGGGNETAGQLISEGWGQYLAGSYSGAVSKFNQALTLDGTAVDAYNGLGWSYAKLDQIASSVSKFDAGLSRDGVNNEMRAGLAFVRNAQKLYGESDSLAGVVLVANAGWIFSRDHTVNAQDLHLLMAENYFAIASYALSLAQVQVLNGVFTVDVSTVAGQTALAKEIERLKTVL